MKTSGFVMVCAKKIYTIREKFLAFRKLHLTTLSRQRLANTNLLYIDMTSFLSIYENIFLLDGPKLIYYIDFIQQHRDMRVTKSKFR